MNEELLVVIAILVQSGALLVSHNGFSNFFAIVQCLANQVFSAPTGRQVCVLRSLEQFKNSKTSRVVYSQVFLSLHVNKRRTHLISQSL